MDWSARKWNRLRNSNTEDVGPFAAMRDVRIAVRAVYFSMGLLSTIWVLLVPELKLRYGLADGEIGRILFASGLGGAVALPLSTAMMLRWGCRATVIVGTVFVTAVVPLALPLGTPLAAGFALLGYGIANGLRGIALGTHAVRAETVGERPVMSSFHAFFSIGGLVAAAAISQALKHGVEAQECLLALTGIVAAISAVAVARFRPRSFDAVEGTAPKIGVPRRAVWVLGAFCFVCYLAESAVAGWSANLMRFSRGCEPGDAGYAYAAFAGAMTVSRLVGDRVTARFGPVTAMRLGAATAGLGMTVAAAVPSPIAGIIGFAVMGLGAGNTVPIIFSAAGRVPGLPPSLALPGVSAFGMTAFLGGPAVIGLVADTWTLPNALLGVGLFYAFVALGARAVR